MLDQHFHDIVFPVLCRELLAGKVVKEDDLGEDQAEVTRCHLILAREASDPMEVFAE